MSGRVAVRQYSPELDGLRGVAIFLVLMYHYVVALTPVEPTSPWWLVHRALSSGWSGVDLFFVLSGFLIGGILEDNKEASNYFAVFYWRRACRILPIYLLSLFVAVGIPSIFAARFAGSAFTIDPLPVWSYLLFVQNLLMAFRAEFGGWTITWSLAVEEQFYLVLPLFMRFRRNWLVPVLVLGCIFAPLLRMVLPNPVAAYVLPMARADSLFLGVLLALLVRHQPHVAAKLGSTRGLRSFLAGACLLMTLAEPSYGGEPMRTLGILLFALTYAAFLLKSQVCRGDWLNGFLRNDALGWLGRRAYFVYLAHMTALAALHLIVLKQRPRHILLEDFVVTGGALVATLLAAEISWRFVERPAIAAGHRLAYSG